jgi:hypothetical protein
MRRKLKKYWVTIKNTFAAMENLDVDGDTIRQNIKISIKENFGLCESKSHKPWFEEEFFKLVDRRKRAKLQWFQNPSKLNEDNLSNVRREASRHFRNKKREYLKD